MLIELLDLFFGHAGEQPDGAVTTTVEGGQGRPDTLFDLSSAEVGVVRHGISHVLLLGQAEEVRPFGGQAVRLIVDLEW